MTAPNNYQFRLISIRLQVNYTLNLVLNKPVIVQNHWYTKVYRRANLLTIIKNKNAEILG